MEHPEQSDSNASDKPLETANSYVNEYLNEISENVAAIARNKNIDSAKRSLLAAEYIRVQTEKLHVIEEIRYLAKSVEESCEKISEIENDSIGIDARLKTFHKVIAQNLHFLGQLEDLNSIAEHLTQFMTDPKVVRTAYEDENSKFQNFRDRYKNEESFREEENKLTEELELGENQIEEVDKNRSENINLLHKIEEEICALKHRIKETSDAKENIFSGRPEWEKEKATILRFLKEHEENFEQDSAKHREACKSAKSEIKTECKYQEVKILEITNDNFTLEKRINQLTKTLNELIGDTAAVSFNRRPRFDMASSSIASSSSFNVEHENALIDVTETSLDSIVSSMNQSARQPLFKQTRGFIHGQNDKNKPSEETTNKQEKTETEASSSTVIDSTSSPTKEDIHVSIRTDQVNFLMQARLTYFGQPGEFILSRQRKGLFFRVP